jgi:hypothetical protein
MRRRTAAGRHRRFHRKIRARRLLAGHEKRVAVVGTPVANPVSTGRCSRRPARDSDVRVLMTSPIKKLEISEFLVSRLCRIARIRSARTG